MRALNLIPEVCQAEDASQCPEILERIRRMNEELTRESLADASLSLTALKVVLIIGAVLAVISLINHLTDNKGERK